MRRALCSAIASVLIACSTQLFAAPPTASLFRPISSSERIQIRSDKGYVLLRIDTSIAGFSADIMRIPTDAELKDYDNAELAAYNKQDKRVLRFEDFAFQYKGNANIFEINPGRSIASIGKLAVTLAEVEPGSYVFYGQGSKGALNQCFCLGTVGFAVPAGRIIDLGTMIAGKAWEPAKIPELESESGLGKAGHGLWNIYAIALRPHATSDFTPQAIDGKTIDAAALYAVGPFVEPNTYTINRLAPIPGVLSYDGPRVIDVASGKEALPN